MGRLNKKSPFLLPSKRQVKKYENSMDFTDGPRLRLDGKGNVLTPLQIDPRQSQSSDWNCRCAVIFARKYVKLNDAHTTNIETVAKALTTHIKALQSQYRSLPNTDISDAVKTKHARAKRRSYFRTGRKRVRRSVRNNF